MSSTKTRSQVANRPTWQAIGKLHPRHAPYCPIRALHSYLKSIPPEEHQDDLPLLSIINKQGLRTAWNRHSFITQLRALIQVTSDKHALGLDPSRFAGRSFRRGSLTELAKHTDARRVAMQADHASLESANVYVVDTIEARANNSNLIARGFQDTV